VGLTSFKVKRDEISPYTSPARSERIQVNLRRSIKIGLALLAVLQKMEMTSNSMFPFMLLRLGYHSEEVGDAHYLIRNISFANACIYSLCIMFIIRYPSKVRHVL